MRAAPRLLAAVVLFALPATTSPAAPAWQDPVEIAQGRGEKGPWQQNESRYDYVDDPAVSALGDGAAAVAWVAQGSKDVWFTRIAADGNKAAPVNVSRSPHTFSWLPRLLARGADVYVLWQEIIFSGGSHGGDMLFARSSDGGATFSAPVNLSGSIGGDGKGRISKDVWHNGSYDLALAPDGMLYVAWTEYDGPLWLSRSDDGGKRFSQPRRLLGAAPERPARAPSLAVGPDGAVYLAWTTGEDPAADIRVARSSDRGASFGEPVVAARTPGYSDAPKIAVDAGGTLHLAFAESSGGPFERYRVRYARSRDAGRTFEPSRDISGAQAAFPQLALDARGGVHVVWERMRSARVRPHGLGYAASRDAGETFSKPELIPASGDPAGGGNGSHQGLLMKKLDVAADGRIVVANSSLREGRGSRVWLMRGAAQGG